jgi:aspartyl aminopeptidase
MADPSYQPGLTASGPRRTGNYEKPTGPGRKPPCAYQKAHWVIPNLAIHLNRDINKGFEYNAQTHLPCCFPLQKNRSRYSLGSQNSFGAISDCPDAILGSDLYFVDAQGPAILAPLLN